MGTWSVVVLLRTDDFAAHMLCVTTVVAYMSAGVARTFGRPRIFQLQMLVGCGPLVITLIYVGGTFHIAVALLSAVFFAADPAAHIQPAADLFQRLDRARA
ncbi:MAG: hypothetical protein MZV49_18475 [Rhodopseudomonas palustris]|nr:hypothetical protein [Rhodopseudomonas palustris]